MRIILLVVFYIAAYASRIAAGGIAATTISGNSVKSSNILRQKPRITRSRVSEVSVDDGMTQKTIKRGKQSSSVNRIDGFLQTRRLTSGKSTRIRRSPRGRTRRARNSDDEVARRRDDLENDDDTDADDVWPNVPDSQKLPVWQVSESPVPATNSAPTKISTAIQMEIPENSDSDRSSRTDEAILPLAYSNSRKMLYETPEIPPSEWESENQNLHEPEAVLSPRKPLYVLSYPDKYTDTIDESFTFPKTARHLSNSEPNVEPRDTSPARSPVSRKPIEKVLVPVYRLGTLVDAYSSRFFSEHQETTPSWHSDNKEKSQVKDNRASSFRRFLLVPVFKDLYVLKDVDEDSRPRTSMDGDNATSAVLAFKAHLHHDAKDVGRAYLRGRLLKHQHRLRDHDANSSHPDLDSGVFQEENVDPAGETISYPNFLYPGVSFQTYPSLIDTVPEMSDEKIALQAANPGLNHRNSSFVDSGIDLDAEIGSYDQSKFPSTSSSFDTPDYDVSSYPENTDNRRAHIFEMDKIGQFSGNYEESPKYNEFDVESTTVDLLKFLSTLGDDIDVLITVADATDDDKALSSEFTTEVYSPDNPEDHTTSVPLFYDTEEQSSKRGQTEVENSRAFLMAIEPLSSELQRLLSAVKLVNKSISDVQARLCDKKNVVGPTRFGRDNEEEKDASSIDTANYYDPAFSRKNLDRLFRKRKRIEGGTDGTKLRKRSNNYSLFLNKLTTPSRSSVNDSETRGSRGDFFKESNQRKSFDSKPFKFIADSPRLRLNRKLKSLTRNHEPIGRFIGSGFEKMMPDNKDNLELPNSKRDLERYSSIGSTTSRETYTPIDPELYKEATAYLDVLRLLNMTWEPRTEYPIIADFSTSTFTKSLPMLTPPRTEFADITTMYLPRLEEETTILGVTRLEELPGEVTELIPFENKTDYTTDFEYYGGIDYDDRNYTKIYGEENVTSWYEYTEETTRETEKVSETIIEDTVFEKTTSVEVTEVGISATTETTIWYTTIEYPLATSMLITTTAAAVPAITPEIWETTPVTQVPITLRVFTVPTTSPLLYTTRLPTTVVDEIITSTTKTVTDKTVAVLSTEMYTIEAFEITTPTTERFTIEPTMMLTPLLEGMTGITLKITVPAITETPFGTTLSLVADTVTTERAITATTIARLPTILGTIIKETTLSTLTETVATTAGLTPEEEESPVVQIERTITAEEMTTTESPTTTEAPITTETSVTTETLTTSETPTTTVARTIKMPTIIETTSARKIPTTTRTPTTVGVPTTAKILTTTEIRTTTKVPTTRETSTTIKITTTSIKIPTTTIKIPTTTKVPTITKPPTTTTVPRTTKILTTIGTPTITKIPTTIKTPTTTRAPTTVRTAEIMTETTMIKIPTIIRAPTTIEVLTTTETLTTSETPITTESTTITKMPTTTVKVPITTEAPTTTETLAATETSTTIETPTTIEVLTSTEISTTTEIPSTVETSTTILTTTEIVTISETSIITESTTIAKISITTVKIPITTEPPATTETLAATESSTTIETPTISEILTTTEIPTISETPSIAETPTILTTIEIVTTSEIPMTTESTTTKTPVTTIELPTIKESPITAETLTITETQKTTEIPTVIETTTAKISTTIEVSPTTESSTIKAPTTVEISTTTQTSTITETRSTVSTTTFSTTLSTFSTETTESIATMINITTTSPIERLETVTTSPISTAVSIETSPLMTDMIVNATVPSTTASIITEILESTISPLVNFTTSFITRILATTTIATGTTAEEYEEYYRETSETEEEVTATASTAKTEEESTTISIITEETIAEVTTPTYVPSPITFFIETTTEATSLANETVISLFTSITTTITSVEIISTVITEGTTTSTTEEVTSAKFTTVLEETAGITFTTEEISTEVTWISTERSTVSEIGTIIPSTSFVPTIFNVTEIVTSTVLPETTIETTETTSTETTTVTLLPTTQRPEYEEILEILTTETFIPFTESTLITTETPVTEAEVTSALPETVSEMAEFTTPSTTEGSTTSFIETTVAISTSVTTTEAMPEVEKEYYVDKALETQYEEEEYDTEIPTDKWYYYDEYETTTKEKTVQEEIITPSTVSYTTLPEERMTSSPLVEVVTTLPYETKTSEFVTSPTISETATIRVEIISTTSIALTTSRTPSRTYVTPTVTLETSTSTVVETLETTEFTESTISTATEKEETVTTTATFGSTEEYTLPPSTVLEITTKPLESLTIAAKYTETDWLEAITRPEEIPEREVELEKTTFAEIATISERVPVEKTTLVFVSPVLTTLLEKELMDVYATTVSSVISDLEEEITSYEVTTQSLKTMSVTEESTIYDIGTTITTYTGITKLTTEEILPHVVTPFTVPEIEVELTTMSKLAEDVVREEQKKRLLQEFDELTRHEKEIAEREERLKEKERQWDREKKKRKEKMMQRKEEEMEEATTIISTTVMSTTSIVTDLTTITLIGTEVVSTESPTMSIATTLEITPFVLDTTFATWSTSTEVTTAWTETTSFYTTEASTSTTLATSIAVTESEYDEFFDEEIENLKKQLREKEHDLDEREKMLLERERRLEEDMEKFEKYMEELEREKIDTSIMTSEESTATSEESTATSEESTTPTSLTTPVPPTELSTTAKARVIAPVEETTEKKETRTTVKTIVTPRRETTKAIEEKKRTTYVPEEVTMPEEEKEIVTKRICLNVLANTTIPYEKKRRDIMTKKICLPYFPERKKMKRSVGRLGRKILAIQLAREIEEPRVNFLPDLQRRKRRRITGTRKISNLQLSRHEWLSNETTKSLRYFKGFTRMYEGTRRIFLKNAATITDARRNGNGAQATTSSYERHVFDRHESSFRSSTTAMSGGKEYRKRSVFPGGDLIRKTKRDLSDNNNNEVTLGDTATTEESNFDEDEFRSYTVNVLHLKYNEDEETHQTISVKPNENEATVESSSEQEYEDDENDDFDHVDSGEDDEVAKPYYEPGESNDVEKNEEEDNDLSEKIREVKNEKEEEEEDDYDRVKTSTYDVKILVDPSERGALVGKQKELMDQAWPTEKSTTYHLGGTRYWELEFQVTETTNISGTTTETATETVDLSVTRTTCLYVVLKNERNHTRTKRKARHREKSARFPATSGQRDNFLQNVTTSEHILRNEKPRTKRSAERRSVSKFDKFSALMKGRKLCGITENKLKHRAAKHKDTRNIKHNSKKVKSTKLHESQDVNAHAPQIREVDSVINKKNSDQHKKMIAKATVNHHTRVKNSYDGRNDGKLALHDVAKHKNEYAKKTRDCADCICDIVDMINHVKSILNRLSYPLGEIKALNCSRYKEIQDKIVISVDSDVEEDARMFPQPRYNTESLKGQKYIKSENLGSDSKGDLVLENDHDIISLPGLNLNVPCNRDGDDVTWLSSISRPSYTWKRTDGIALYGFVAENGDLELRNVNAKDTGNYTCVVTYTGADNEEPVEATYEVRLRVVTLPRYILHGEGRYRVRFCDERDLDALATYLPLKLNNVLCEADICNAYVLTPSCSRSQITMNVLIVPSHIVKLTTIDHKHCNVFCLKAIQDKLSLILSKNLQIFLEKTIIFRLPHFEQKLVPIAEKPSLARRKRGKSDEGAFGDGFSNEIGLFSSCPAGYGLRGTHCVPCDVGTYSEDGISRCKRCPPGTYQPNHGARVCRTCTSPLTRGCYNMLWNSFSAVMVTLASLSAMLSICLLLLWVTCCAKKKFCAKRIISVVSDKDAFQQEKLVEEQPLIRDVNENEDQQWDGEHRVKRKRGKFNVNRKRRKQSEKRYEKTRVHEDEWESHRAMDAPINSLDSYRSHEDYNNHYPKQSHRKGPRLPERDFDT